MKNNYIYQYTIKCKYILKMIQIITKFDEVLNHILNIISIPCENFHSCNFTKNIWMKIFIQKIIIMLKNYFQLKDNKKYVGGLYIKIHFTCLSKH